jgi:pimeloyl-ACP methyl ester carboxylesterase
MRLFFLGLALFGSTAFAVCNDLPGGKVHYCVYETPGSTNPDVIYYLHGRFGQAERWEEADFYTEGLRQYWQANGKPAPRVVAVSFGPVWLLAEKNPSNYSGLFEVMRDQVIPALEQIIGGTSGKRMILGESMGGFNSLQLALKTGLFEKAAILCAPVAQGVDPWSTEQEVDAWIRKSAAFAYYGEANRSVIDEAVGEMLMMSQQVWQTRANWQTADTLNLAATVDKSSAPVSFYINAGFYDQFALYEGNLELVKILLGKKNVKVEWHPEWGDHCAIDIPSLARFLVP